jgi:hypothetical protein
VEKVIGVIGRHGLPQNESGATIGGCFPGPLGPK